MPTCCPHAAIVEDELHSQIALQKLTRYIHFALHTILDGHGILV